MYVCMHACTYIYLNVNVAHQVREIVYIALYVIANCLYIVMSQLMFKYIVCLVSI